jgi:serine protease Do
MMTKQILRLRVAVVAGALVVGGLTAALAQRNHGLMPDHAPLALRMGDPAPASGGYADVVAKDTPAVVSISSARVVKASAEDGGLPFMDPFFRRFFGDGGGDSMPRRHKETAAGSGVIVTPDGYVVTNNHVIDKSTQIAVTLSDRREFKARLIGADPKTDIAVLKIDASGLPTLAVADSSKVRVGDLALAIGNPFGIGQTVTLGIVSATGRGNLGIEDYEDFIQTDAAINPGNSGGALVNSRGDLIGINTAILSPNGGGNNGVGFAVPSNLARHVMEELVAHGKVTRAYLGVMLQPLTAQLAAALGAKDSHGALVADITPDGPAAHSGLQKGDIIREFNGEPVSDSSQLRLRVGSAEPGSVAHFKVWRNGSELPVAVTLAEMPSTMAASGSQAPSQESPLNGVELRDLNSQVLRQLELPATTQGVLVTGVDPAGPAADAGLRPGDIIQQVNHTAATSVAQLEKLLAQSGRKTLLLTVLREGNTLFLALEAQS